ncbi:MAG: hydroxymethylglutaryl-CoA lyase, partial [Proteobacteria bacterium]|nr:hydroxymethylglutaryl-CoA lyase [Pseudomonadota bacterium]
RVGDGDLVDTGCDDPCHGIDERLGRHLTLERINAIQTVAGEIPLRVHFHDTRHTGIASTYAAIEAGVTTIDASVGGIGGCPFAPAATGNIATDDLVYMLNRGGFEHGVSLAALIGVSQEVESLIHKPVPAMLPVAGDFPPD